jgi:predicted tellurium resistance membrane protein TerC
MKLAEHTKETISSLLWSFAGNLLPVWLGAIISILDLGFSKDNIIAAVHQPYTFLILSAAYLTNAAYLIRKQNNTNSSFNLIYFVLVLIIGFLVSKRKTLEDLSANDESITAAYVFFIISILAYVVYQYKYFYNQYNLDYNGVRNQQGNQLNEDFDRLAENQNEEND